MEGGKRRCSARLNRNRRSTPLLSYPLHPPQRPEELRTGHFQRLQIPAMFVHGTRDGFGSIDEMIAALKLIPARTELLPIAGAGHELITKQNREQMPNKVVDAFRSFVYVPEP
jgi:uncharacterized protein